MEAKELMINDWVMDESPQQIKELGTEFCTNKNDDLLFTDRLKPIPLTKEILKANGIKYIAGLLWWQRAYPFRNTDKYEVHINEVTAVTVEYVHELQHALRLCGLRELADNFKIK